MCDPGIYVYIRIIVDEFSRNCDHDRSGGINTFNS